MTSIGDPEPLLQRQVFLSTLIYYLALRFTVTLPANALGS